MHSSQCAPPQAFQQWLRFATVLKRNCQGATHRSSWCRSLVVAGTVEEEAARQHERSFCASTLQLVLHALIRHLLCAWSATFLKRHFHTIVPARKCARTVCECGSAEQHASMATSTKFGVMNYRVLGEESASPQSEGSKILFLHGLGSSSETCQPPQSLLSGSTFFVPDFFGHGSSSLPLDPEPYRMASLASSVYDILQ
eukprot:3670513-Rhodomonas_salina.1